MYTSLGQHPRPLWLFFWPVPLVLFFMFIFWRSCSPGSHLAYIVFSTTTISTKTSLLGMLYSDQVTKNAVGFGSLGFIFALQVSSSHFQPLTDWYLFGFVFFFFLLRSFIDLDTTWKNQQSTSFPICICKSEKEPSGKRWTVLDGN